MIEDKPSQRGLWASVTGAHEITFDDEVSPLGFMPESLIPPASFKVNDRLWVLNYGKHYLIIGRLGG